VARSRQRSARPSRTDGTARAAAPTADHPSSPWHLLRLFAWGIVTLLFLVFTALWLEHRITWYLAVDQFGYLRFANDLLNGSIFHHWVPAEALAPLLPPRTDMLAQTYIWDRGELYSRYAPGFPIILATWITVFGRDAAHFLNPTLFIVLLLTMIAFGWQLHRSLWRGTAAAALLMLCPTFAYLWALTLTRDLSAHVSAFIGLTLLLTRFHPLSRRRVLVGGLFLGFSACIRPDALLYLIPASVIGTWRWAKTTGGWGTLARLAMAGLVGVMIGLSPQLAFNWRTTGNPFLPTQSMELNAVFGEKHLWKQSAVTQPGQMAGLRVGYPSPGWHGGTKRFVQGGGLRIENLPRVLPGNLRKIYNGYGGMLLGAAGLGLVVTMILRPIFAAAMVPYMIVALLFFSCWARPDSRYLLGLWVLFPMFIIEGMVGIADLVRWLWRRQSQEMARGVAVVAAIGLLLGYALFSPSPDNTALPTLTWMIMLLGTAALIGAAIFPGRRIVGLYAPLVMITMTGLAVFQANDGLEHRASFQRPQAERAARVFRKAVRPNAVVITTEDVGRPMENIEYYADIHSLYLTDLKRWRLSVRKTVLRLFVRSLRPYLLLPPSSAAPIVAHLREKGMTVVLVEDIPPARNYDFFVAAPFHRGIPMHLYELSFPAFEDLVKQYDALQSNLEPGR